MLTSVRTTGLGLEICRYNIGGSGWANKDTKNFRYGADVPRYRAALAQFDACAALSYTCGRDASFDAQLLGS